MKKIWGDYAAKTLSSGVRAGISIGINFGVNIGISAIIGISGLLATHDAYAQKATLSFVRELGDVREYQLPNGLQVLLLQDSQRPAMSVNITYRVGSRHEGLGEFGAAHLLEHMLFKPSGYLNGPSSAPKYKDAKTSMQTLGMRWNGTTSYDRTNYFANFNTNDGKLPERLDFMIGWLSTMMTQARFSADDLKSEMTVVRNEFERGDNEANRILGDRIRSAAYTTHGYGHPTIGTRADIENIPFDRLQAFYRQHYRPDNATLIIAGDFKLADVKTRIEREFGGIAKPTVPLPTTWSVEPPQEGEKLVTLRRSGGLASAIVAYHGPAGPTREAAAAWLLTTTLSQVGGPLQKGLVNRKLAVTEWAFYPSLREPAPIYAGIGLPELEPETSDAQYEIKAKSAAAALAKVVEVYRLSADELETARASILATLRANFRNTEATAMSLSEAVASGDWRLPWTRQQLISQISLDEVHQLAQTYLVPNNRTTGVYLPLPAVTASSASNTSVTSTINLKARAPQTFAPTASAIAQLIETTAQTHAQTTANTVSTTNSIANSADFLPANAIKVRQDAPSFTITNPALAQHTQQGRLTVGDKPGLKVAVMTRQSKEDRVHGTLRLRWGTLESQQSNSVLASMLSTLIPEGIAASENQPIQDAKKIKARALALDASIRFSSAAGFLSANLEFPAQNTAAVMALLNDLLRRPAFSQTAFDRNRQAMLAAIEPMKSNPNNLAKNLLERNYRSHYVAGDPREVRELAETQRQIRALTVDQVKAYWQRFGSAQQGEFVLVGPLDLEPVQALAQQLWGDWISNEPHTPWETKHGAPSGEIFSQIQVPEKSNATYTARIAFPLNRQHPDYAPLLVGIEAMSRQGLWERIREKEGLSYGVGATLNAAWTGDNANIDMNASFAPQNLQRLRTSVKEVLEKSQREGYASSVIDQAKSSLLARFRDHLTQPASAVDTIAGLLHYDRALDANIELMQRYEKLDTATVNAALKKYLDVAQLREVAAGSF